MNVATKAGQALSRYVAPQKRRPNVQLSLFDSPVALGRRREAESSSRRSSKLVSVELDVAGMAVELKAKNLSGLLVWLSLDLTIAAVIQELMRPRQFRTWHGKVAGVVPYDFRKPTVGRILNAVWAPDNPRLLTDTAFGVGWTINWAQVPRFLFGAKRAAATRTYEPPRVAASR
ncbi:MAG TPA: DUF5808 domain-containing protein [Chloroflexota bacterium]|nr:DUF5808 domain-containing protein [Chloroflexota bacterium]